MPTAALVLLAVLAEAPPPRLLGDEVGASVGVLGNGVSALGGIVLADSQLTAAAGYRASFSGWLLDLGVMAALPLKPDSTALAITGAARVGYSGERWAVLGGVLLQGALDTVAPLSVLPTLHAAVDLGPVGLSAGVLDLLGLVPAHLTVEARADRVAFSVGYVAPLGALAGLELPGWRGARIRVTALAYRLFQADFAFLSVGFTMGTGR